MKKNTLILLTLVLLSVNGLVAQQQSDIFYSGRLWVQLDPAYTKTLIAEKRQVGLQGFLDAIQLNDNSDLQIAKVEKPFYFARTANISEVYTVFFQEEGREEEFARMLQQFPAVNYAERVPIIRPTLMPNDLGSASGQNNQWGLWKINAPDAWDISTGSTDITVAIVDDAVLITHPDLIPNLVPGYDVADDDNDPMPNVVAMSHGTHVAGIVGAATNNGIGVASIGHSLKIMPVKSSNVPQTISDAYSGVIWAADNGADVINMSWGSEGYSNTGQNIINYAYNAGCVNVAATGNDNMSSVFYPAGYNNVLSVSSTNSSDSKSDFSNYGSWVDVSAPGSQILSTYIGQNFAPTYASNSGTSMASPMVAGLAGLVLSVNPNLSIEQVMNCITSTAQDITSINPNYVGQLGAGRIDAYQAMLCVQATVNAPPVVVINASSEVICPGSLVHFSGASAGGFPDDYLWSFPGGNPASSTDPNPVVSYAAVGFYDVSLTMSNQFGSDQQIINGMIEVSTNGIAVIFSEDFEAQTLSGAGWTLDNPDNGITWEITTVGGSESGSKAAGINLYSYNSPGQRDGMVSPPINLASNNNVTLSFEHAHRRYSADYSDSLIVYVSTDGGNSFPNRVLQVAETGAGTFATGTLLGANFVPSSSGDWCFMGDVGASCFSIDLSDFDGEPDVRIKFESYNGYGNNIYIDNVALTGNCLLTNEPPVAAFSASAVAVCTSESIQFFDQSANVPLTFNWTFENGTPATSNLAAPVVNWSQPGTYTVTLQVTNSLGSDIIVYEDYIMVSNAPEVEVNASEIILCQGQSATLEASGADEYTWSPNVALSSTTGSSVEASPTVPITYTVTAMLNGCSAQQTIALDVLPSPSNPQVISQNEIAFTVLSPAISSGYYGYSTTSSAQGWGNGSLNAVSVESQMVLARDNAAADSLLCNTAINASEIAGNIAVIYRGNCEFGTKALNAQAAGAVGVVVINNVSGAPIDMGAGAAGSSVTIPVIMVSDITGALINAAIHAGEATAVMGQFNGGDFTICPGETVRLAAPGGWNDYLWSNGEGGAVLNIFEAGDYSVEVFSDNECSSSSEVFTVSEFTTQIPVIETDVSGGLIVNNIAAGPFTWYFNNNEVAGVTGNLLPNPEAGIYHVTYIDNNGCEVMSDPYEVVVTSVVNHSDGAVQIFPVPATDRVTVSWSYAEVATLQVFAADGKVVFAADGIPANQQQIDIPVNAWAPGVYMVRISGDSGVYTGRLVKNQ